MKYHEIKLISRELRKNPTPYEKQLWRRIRDRQLGGYKFLRQHPIIYNRNGNDLNIFIPDFYCAKVRLVIELDGGVHKNTEEHGLWREEILSSMNITVLRIQNEELVAMDDVLLLIYRNLSALDTLTTSHPPSSGSARNLSSSSNSCGLVSPPSTPP
ncbi:MAG: DUF559 domain-containing protein [Bacteroidetes bacterium]|nr:DUF559 domain-containing protein [Bacteroidota bacterium]